MRWGLGLTASASSSKAAIREKFPTANVLGFSVIPELKGRIMDEAQRISVVLEFDEEHNEWLVVAVLIDDKGARRRNTLARVSTKTEASKNLETLFGNLPIQMGGTS